MYPNLYYAFKDLFGVEWGGLHFVNTFGFFVALAFVGAAFVLTAELKRKEAQGLLQFEEQTIVVGKPASFRELLINAILGFVLGYKIIGLFLSKDPRVQSPQDFIFSADGNWVAGIALAALFAFLKWREKDKQKLTKPEERRVRIWPHDRVGDITIQAAIFGFAGAKIFNSLETWDDFVRNPIESLISFSGLTFYGGLICAALAIWYYARKHHIGFWALNDAAAPSLMLAYALGRIGCQTSGDGDWGIVNSAYLLDKNFKPVAATVDQVTQAMKMNSQYYIGQYDSPAIPHLSVKAPAFLPDWLFAYAYPHNVVSEGARIPGCAGQYCGYLPLPVFPTPFYETVVCLGLFFLLWSLRKKIKVPGMLFGVYLMLNGVERFFIEKIRVNSRYSFLGFHPTQAEIISTLLIVAGAGIYFSRRKKRVGTAAG